MTASLDPKFPKAVGLPGEIKETTAADVQGTYKPSTAIKDSCDKVDTEIARLAADYRAMDSRSESAFFRIVSGALGGVSISAAHMASGLGRAVQAFRAYPISDVLERMVKGTPAEAIQKMGRGAKKVASGIGEGIVQMGDGVVKGKDLIADGRYAEGTSVLAKSAADILSLLYPLKAPLMGIFEKGGLFVIRETTAGATGARALIDSNMGGGVAIATTAGSVAADGTALAKTAAVAATGPGRWPAGLGVLAAMSDAAGEGGGAAASLTVDDIRAQLKAYGEQHGLRGLEGRVERGLDAAGMLAVKETRMKLEALAQQLGADMGKVEKLTHDLHVGGIWENADRLALASEAEVQVWMIASDLVSEGEKGAAQFLADFKRVNTGLDEAVANPYGAAYAAKERMVEAASGKFVLEDGIPVSTSDSFVEMAVCGHKTGIVKDGDLLFVGAKELDYSVLNQRGLVPEMRMDRGREALFYVNAEGKPVVKKLYDGFAIVLDGDMTVAKDLAWSTVDTGFDDAIMRAFNIKPYEFAEGLDDARMVDNVVLTPALKQRLAELVNDGQSGGTFNPYNVEKALATAEASDESVATLTVKTYDGKTATVKVRHVESSEAPYNPNADANIMDHHIDIIKPKSFRDLIAERADQASPRVRERVYEAYLETIDMFEGSKPGRTAGYLESVRADLYEVAQGGENIYFTGWNPSEVRELYRVLFGQEM